MSCSGRYASTLAISLASWARVSSSQNTAGAPVARARVTASLTQSRIGDVLGLAGAPDVAGLDVVLEQHVAGRVDDAHGAGGGDLEGLVVGAVLLGRLRHQADVGHRAHRGRVEGAVGAAVVDDGLVDAGVATSRGSRRGCRPRSPSASHIWPRGADHRRHRGVDDDVARHVQVGDAAVGVDHRQRRAVGDARPRSRPRSRRRSAQRRRARPRSAAEAVVGVEARGGELLAVLREDVGEERRARRGRR